MKRLNYFFYLLVLFSSLSWAASSEMNASCSPNGITAVMKEKMNPKSFWAHQSTIAESMLGYWQRGGDGDEGGSMSIGECQIEAHGDRIKYEKCVTYIRSEINFWARCGQHARNMCRLHGGYC